MAVVGGSFAILQSGRFQLSGWLAWAVIHLTYLPQYSLRIAVFIQWLWTYLAGQRGSLLISPKQGTDRNVSKKYYVFSVEPDNAGSP